MATETTARQFLFAVMIFGAMIAGAFTLISFAIPSTNSDFGLYNNTYNRFEEINTEAESVHETIKDDTPGGGTEGILSGLISSSWGSIGLIWDSAVTLKAIVQDSSTGGLGVISLPVWFTGTIVTIIFIIIAFALMAAIFKWRI